jgi:thiol-disulfide isomerase/thioredoxin
MFQRRFRACVVLLAICALAFAIAMPARDDASTSAPCPAQSKAPKAPPQQAASAHPAVLDAAGYKELLARHRGRAVMVNFWATWCEPCREEYPMINELARAYAPQGLVVIGISLDDDAEVSLVRRFLAQRKPVFTNYRKKPGNDEGFINTVDLKWSGAVPATFFYARDGRLAGKLVGENTREAFEKALREQLKLSAPKTGISTR